MKKAREYIESDKLKKVYICKIILSNDETNEKAKFCNKIIVNNGNTSAINNHLSTQHIQFIKKTSTINNSIIHSPSSIKSLLLNEKFYDTESEKYNILTSSVEECLTECNLPLSLVDNPAFIKMLSKFDNKYKLPRRKLLTEKYLQKAVENQKKNIQTLLENEAEFVSPAITRLLQILQIYSSKYGDKKIEDLAKRMHDELSDRTREYFNNPLLAAATYLDPR